MASQKQIGDYVQEINPQGYVNNREITNLPGYFLVKGSRNCLIVNKEKTSSRLGYSLLGQAKTKNVGHNGSFDWETSGDGVGGVTRSLRLNKDGEIEVFYKGLWYLLFNIAKLSKANWTTWWDSSELLDILLFVVGTNEVHTWAGGIVEIASSTASTLTMKGYVTGTTYAFNDNGSMPDTITDSSNGFITAGFKVGDTITVSGSMSNDGTYRISAVSAGLLILATGDLTAEVAGATVIIQKPGATWGESRFLTANTRAVRVNDVEYVYTGGEDTGTLTGLSGVSGVSAGDIAMQAIITTTPDGLADFKTDLVSMYNNYVFYGSKTSRHYFCSKSTDFTDFTHSTPRIPTEGFEGDFDSTPTAFVPDEDVFWVSGRKDDWYKITFTLAADQTSESLQVVKLKTATGQGAQSQDVIINMKNQTAFLSFEPTIDTLGNIPNLLNTSTAVPISDDIRDDLLTYNLEDAHGKFYQNQMFIAYPRQGVVSIYNTQYKHWQPPQELAISRIALIDIDGSGTQRLCGHSSVTNESYLLFDGYNDNGIAFPIDMIFGYDNFGTRFSTKHCDEFATELYASENTNITHSVVFDYEGATGIVSFEIKGSDESIRFKPVETGGFGKHKDGDEPLGSLTTPIEDLSKLRPVDCTPVKDFFERQRKYSSNSIDARFSLIAMGENVELSENIPAYLKR